VPRFLLAALGLALAFAGAAPASREPVHGAVDRLVVVSDDHYPPYLFRDEEGRLQGIVKDRWAAAETTMLLVRGVD